MTAAVSSAAAGSPAIAEPLAQMLQAGVADALARFGSLRVAGLAEDSGDCHVVSGSLHPGSSHPIEVATGSGL